MKKTRYYLKFGEQKSTFGVDPKEWFEEFGWEFEKSNNLNLYFDKQLNQLYCYQKPSLMLRDDWGQTVYALHSPDVMIDYEKEVEIKETVTKLPMETRYKNGINWKASKRSLNPGLQKTKKSKLEEEKRKRDMEFFKMRENFKLKKPKS